jgi:hypothetical protein
MSSAARWAMIAALVLIALPARATAPCPKPEGDPTDQARRWFEEGLKLEPSSPEEAVDRLECASALVDRPAIELRLGIIHERLAHFDEAIAAYRRYLELAGEGAPDHDAMSARIADLEKRRDGAHAAHVRGKRRRIAGWIVAAAGAALGITGAVLMRVAQSDNDAAHEVAPGTTLYDSDEVRGRIERAQVEQGVGIAAIAVGVLATGTGLGLALAPDGPVSVALSPNGIAARWRF